MLRGGSNRNKQSAIFRGSGRSQAARRPERWAAQKTSWMVPSLRHRSESGRLNTSNEPSPWTGGTQTAMQVQDFAAVLARARQGDPEAMARLVEEYEPEVRRVAHRRLGPALRAAVDSADLVHSVHRSLLFCLKQNKFTFAGPQDLIALAVTMVKRKVARKWKRLQREQEILQLQAQLLSQARPDHAAELADKIKD